MVKVRIDVRVVNGRLCDAIGGDLPKLRNGAIGELVVEVGDIQSVDFLLARKEETTREIDTREGVAIRLSSAKKKIPSSDSLQDLCHLYGPFAAVEVEGPIRIRYKVGDRPRLERVKVKVPDLKLTASSLNNACTKLSEAFETDRETHTYNAFEVVHIRRGMRWFPLKELV